MSIAPNPCTAPVAGAEAAAPASWRSAIRRAAICLGVSPCTGALTLAALQGASLSANLATSIPIGAMGNESNSRRWIRHIRSLNSGYFRATSRAAISFAVSTAGPARSASRTLRIELAQRWIRLQRSLFTTRPKHPATCSGDSFARPARLSQTA
jgi:hypothetical protein